ncbi:MAG: sigma-70 family RNA polymerase sigma factor [Bacteroidales bacterium]|nr:sigma-70 family RNA polymerase sigma factor [Bacteroidales bacterium]
MGYLFNNELKIPKSLYQKMGYSDNEIIKAIESGKDRDVLKYLYKIHFPKVKKYIMNHSGDSDTAFDVFQDSIVVFYKYVKEKKFDTAYETGAFIFTVSKNIWLNKVQKDKRNVALPEYAEFRDDGQSIMDQLITREREKMVSDILRQLGEKCEKLLQYSIFYRLRNAEICERMGFSTENAVKTRKYKCMQKLISIVEKSPSLKKALQEL